MDKRNQRRREEIIEAALFIFAEKGYHNAKISDIAQYLNIGHGTFYRYFKNKLDIFTAIIDKIIMGILELIIQESPNKADNLEEYRQQLRRIGEGLFHFFSSDSRLAKIFIYESLGVAPELNEKLESSLLLFSDYTEKYLKNGIQKGFLRKDLDTRICSMALNAMILQGIRDVLISSDPQEVSKKWIDAVIRLMLEGIAE